MLRIGRILAGSVLISGLLSGCFPTKEQAYEDYCLFHPEACKITDSIKEHAGEAQRQIRAAGKMP